MGEDPLLEGWSRHKVCLSDPVNRPLPIYFALGRADDKPDDAVSTAPADWDMTPSDTDCALGFVWDACDMLDDVGVRFDFVVNGVPWEVSARYELKYFLDNFQFLCGYLKDTSETGKRLPYVLDIEPTLDGRCSLSIAAAKDGTVSICRVGEGGNMVELGNISVSLLLEMLIGFKRDFIKLVVPRLTDASAGRWLVRWCLVEPRLGSDFIASLGLHPYPDIESPH